eukprot:TRINITY_DN5017_c0_g1_i1.p1 TRINITY_DN5017_c0_g1~~TRINITY_DN5017_c0_g1_i1.p1  ORF type:complete len:152 (+),score=16.62 TRINITY_DN5017_c0_g1_i1:77-532(+)
MVCVFSFFFFFFFNDTATTEIYTLHIVGSVRCVQETEEILPFVRSYGDISTFTLSPGKILMQCIRIFPEICAVIVCPFSNSTLNIAFDNDSMIVPSCSIEDCFAINIIQLSSNLMFTFHILFESKHRYGRLFNFPLINPAKLLELPPCTLR